ncbi:MAG TPA: adenylosuccinate synthase, partial [Leptospiraceae bacterium]|nr:adenylosuccinate synthase [Leptospiraceae bacterium]
EGKAKVIDYLSSKIDFIVRYQGGANAGHTVVVDGETYIFHLIPSGILYPNAVCVIGNGVVLDPEAFRDEVRALARRNIEAKERVIISDACHLVLPLHRIIDAHRENAAGEKKIGTTKRGIGICYGDKTMRIGLRAGDVLHADRLRDRLGHILEIKNYELKNLYRLPEVEFNALYEDLLAFGNEIRGMVKNTSLLLNENLAKGKTVLLEGAQGTGLDIDFGTYPYVTSSNTTTGGAIAGSGIDFRFLKTVTGISKAYVSRVGEGPFPTELFGAEVEKLRELGHEYGATTGRPRRCGWFDVELVRHAARVNGLTEIALTKIDVLSAYDTIKIGVGYKRGGEKLPAFPTDGYLEGVEVVYEEMPGWKKEIGHVLKYSDLPPECCKYIRRLEELCEVPIKLVSVGPGREHTIPL